MSTNYPTTQFDLKIRYLFAQKIVNYENQLVGKVLGSEANPTRQHETGPYNTLKLKSITIIFKPGFPSVVSNVIIAISVLGARK